MTLQYARLVQTAKPFVKWAGGKRQLVRALSENMPEKYGTYYEPFLLVCRAFLSIVDKILFYSTCDGIFKVCTYYFDFWGT